jgi:hypothetical protein
MIASMLLASYLFTAPAAPAAQAAQAAQAAPAAQAPAPKAPEGPVVIETKRGRLEFSHKAHAKTACAQCHKDQAVPGKIGVKGKDAAHKFCVDCHKAEHKGPQKCSSCHKRPGTI